jgi:hypothetical protein
VIEEDGVSVALEACLVAALLYGGLPREGQHTSVTRRQEQPAQVVLTNSHPDVSFAISPDIVTASPPLLALTFPRVVNPSNTAFQIFVSFSYRAAQKGPGAPLSILVGNGSLFPADHPGGFVLRTSEAFRKLRADKATGVRLVLEMKPIHHAAPWPPVEVTVAAPQWRQENRN